MALVVEDGTGLANAESYVSVADADAYHTAMGNSAWTGSDAAKEVALRKAAQYLNTRYRFLGNCLKTGQSLAFPRDDIVTRDGLVLKWPIKCVKDAACELALRALSGTLYTDQDDRPVKQETVGPLTVVYGDSQNNGQVRYATVDSLLKPVTGGTNGKRIEVA